MNYLSTEREFNPDDCEACLWHLEVFEQSELYLQRIEGKVHVIPTGDAVTRWHTELEARLSGPKRNPNPST